jgi:hypothetical protein
MGRPGACARAGMYLAYTQEERHGATAPVIARTMHSENIITIVNGVRNTEQGMSWFLSLQTKKKKQQKTYSASELYRPSNCRLSAVLVPIFADRKCHVVSVTDPYSRILGFLDHYYLFQIALQLYSRGWVDPVPDPLLLRKSGSAGNRTRTSGSVAKNSDHYTTEAVLYRLIL